MANFRSREVWNVVQQLRSSSPYNTKKKPPLDSTKMKHRFKILSSPLFLIGLGLLFINDFYLKAQFGNGLTGKLSDICGLFVFPLFLSAFFPKQKNFCFIGTALIFTIWKMPVIDPFIQFLNDYGLPVGRTVDYSDLFALAILPIAYHYQRRNYRSLQLNPYVIGLLSFFIFTATTLPPRAERKYVDINKTYTFEFSRASLIDKLNRLSAKKIRKQPPAAEVHFNSDGDFFYYKANGDTLAILLDSRKINGNDTIHYKTVLADFAIDGDDSTSTITFINAYKVVPAFSDKDYRQKAIKEFEKRVIRKID